MKVTQNPVTGYWNVFEAVLQTHRPDQCAGELCDVHDRRGPEPWASWPLNWRSDRGIMEVICPCGIGHPTLAQADYFRVVSPDDYEYDVSHGCCGIHCPLVER